MNHPLFLLLLIAALFAQASSGLAAEVRVAVASNFLAPLRQLADIYEQQSGDRLIISAGSTGKLYAQIVNGAPFEVFLAANEREPRRLDEEGKVVAGSRFTYSEGRLALLGRQREPALNALSGLCDRDISRISLANPKTAPYGAAAMEVLSSLDCGKALRTRLVRGENVAQAYQFVATGNTQFGFVAVSQLISRPESDYLLVDARSHQPIRQQAVLLLRGDKNPAAHEFIAFLRGESARETIRSFGYGLGD
ncbi:MAG: molybdate ABC transporter substrate-binding protein [Gammaproteobacteria bacterium]